ncbi:hypothetical protein WRSd5_00311 [Shigella dysenteriae WRSd5]|uniref:Uncharacterized protein n=1 Tax=Shigella dysenteriae 1617 TaxID=754093 RepID=A0A0A6ZMU3_SHIDY|nr:hypothetical protein Asd1617_00094 [Shigella dysenteriae 1617]ESU84942.1 hypothetical protein WRSd5_00311 [Shigella dysenteriae WRSd5]
MGYFEQKKSSPDTILMRDECFAIQYHSALSILGPE